MFAQIFVLNSAKTFGNPFPNRFHIIFGLDLDNELHSVSRVLGIIKVEYIFLQLVIVSDRIQRLEITEWECLKYVVFLLGMDQILPPKDFAFCVVFLLIFLVEERF